MNRVPWVAAAALVCGLASVGTGATTAAGRDLSDGSASLDDATLEVGLSVLLPGDGGGVVYAGDDPDAPSPFRYEAVPASSPGIGLEHLCDAGGAPAVPGGLPWGWWYIVTVYDRDTGEVVSREVICVPLAEPGVIALPAAPVLSRPPTIAEVWRAVGLPTSELGVSPTSEGVVGLETRLWADGATEVAVAVSIRGFTVTGKARLVEYRFAPGDGAVLRSDGGGSAAEPAARYVYETKGTRPLRVAAVWDAEAVMTGPGFPAPLPVDLGLAVLVASRDYPVVEIRAVLLP